MTNVLPPKAVVFDLDGTLIDSRGDIVAAMNHALIATKRRPQPASKIVRLVGNGARALCAQVALLTDDDPETDELVQHFSHYYRAHPLDFTRWAPGALEALDDLSAMDDLLIGLCTNKHRSTTEAVLAALGITERFQAIVAGGDVPELKPDPEPLLLASKLLGVDPRMVVMVGDGVQDIECAKNAGTWSIAVESGFTSPGDLMLAAPNVAVKDLSLVAGIVQRWREPTSRLKLR
ncbi:MAG TPA: HAD-IA family hydrolase [Polyangium sp.]|nr:HAD-IA family hydrolase [Polyangium sp.]